MEGGGNTRCVPQFPVQCQALLAERLCSITIAQALIQSRRSKERFCPHRCCHPITTRERSLQKIPSLAEVTAHIPELPERSSQAQGDLPGPAVPTLSLCL